jgi:hypothetical protein
MLTYLIAWEGFTELCCYESFKSYIIIVVVYFISSQVEQNSRQYQHQQSWGPSGGNGGPTQSRSFRVLQKITDTDNSEGKSKLLIRLMQLKLKERMKA